MFFKSKKRGVANSIPDLESVQSEPVGKDRQTVTGIQETLPTSAVNGSAVSADTSLPRPVATAVSTSAQSSPPPSIDLRHGAAISKRMEAALGEIVAVLMRSELHQKMTLAEVRAFVLPAVLLGQFSIAEAQSKANGMTTPVGFVLWANVSPEIDARLSDLNGTAYQLASNDWNSGSIPWVLMALGDQRLVGGLLNNLVKQAWAGRKAKMRIKGADGKILVRVLEPAPAGAPEASTASS